MDEKQFEIPTDFLDHMYSWKDREMAQSVRELCGKAEEVASKSDVADEWAAYTAYVDLAISWRDCWAAEHQAMKSASGFGVVRRAVPSVVDGKHPSPRPECLPNLRLRRGLAFTCK